MAEERWLTVSEVAVRIRTTPDTVRRWIRQGRLHAVMPGGTKVGYRIRQTDVDRLLAGPERRAS